MRIYPYLRASTEDQDALRAKNMLSEFVEQHGLSVGCWFVENESGATLKRPELFRLLDVAQAGDVLLVEQVDRLSRLNEIDWQKLKLLIKQKQIRIVALDLPTSYLLLNQQPNDDFMGRILTSFNELMLDMLAAIARKDYDNRRRMQKQGVQSAKAAGKYKGRPEDTVLHNKIDELLDDKKSWDKIQEFLGCSRGTIAKVSKKRKYNLVTE